MIEADSNQTCRAESDRRQTAEWVELARGGDHTAFHRLVDRFQGEVFRMIFYRTRSQMDAEDLTQDVFLRAYRQIRRLESPLLFRSWLFRIAINRVRDHYRRNRVRSVFGMVPIDDERFQETEDMAVDPEAPGQIDRKDFWIRVGELTACLSRTEREVFLLRFFDQLSLKEISTTMKKNENTIKTHLYRALNKIKAVVADEAPWEVQGI